MTSWYKTSQEFNYETELTPLLKKFAQLDQILTNKNWRSVTQQAWGYKEKFSNPEKMFDVVFGGHIYYLSDGGYSRIGIDDLSGKLYLTSNSLDKPKEKWKTPEAQQLINNIEQDIQTLRGKYEENEEYNEVIKVIKGTL